MNELDNEISLVMTDYSVALKVAGYRAIKELYELEVPASKIASMLQLDEREVTETLIKQALGKV